MKTETRTDPRFAWPSNSPTFAPTASGRTPVCVRLRVPGRGHQGRDWMARPLVSAIRVDSRDALV
jgi:hypothetical protein